MWMALSISAALWLTWHLDQGVTCMTAGIGNHQCRRTRDKNRWMEEMRSFYPLGFFFTPISESSFEVIIQNHVSIKQMRWDDWRCYQSHVKWITKSSGLELQCTSDDSDAVSVLHHLLLSPGGFFDNFVHVICIEIVTYCFCDALVFIFIFLLIGYTRQQSPC